MSEKKDEEKAPLKEEIQNSQSEPELAFSNTFVTICALLGSMIGTGNIWRFPRIAANNSGETGCLQFLIVWLIFLFLWAVPMIIIEYSLGRYTKMGPLAAFKFHMGLRSIWCGGWIVLVDLAIACYYCVLTGWCLYYFYYFIANELPETPAKSQDIFNDFVESDLPVLTHAIAAITVGVTLLWGVRSIEIANSVLIPIVLALLLFSVIYSFTLPDAGQGLKFFYSPDWSLFLDVNMWTDAATQNAFDTSAGQGLMVAYSVFLTRKNGVTRYGFWIPVINNFVSLCCGMMTFSTVFSIGVEAGYNTSQIVELLRNNGEANTGLSFVWMPVLYGTLSIGRGLTVIFFLALSCAGLSSLVGMMQLNVKTLEDFKFSRKLSVIIVVLIVFLVGLGSALNINFLVNQDFVWSFALLISGVMLQSFVIRYGVEAYRKHFVNDYGTNDWHLPKMWEWIVKFVAPLEAGLLILAFAVDQIISSPNEWYTFGTETLMSCLVLWLLLLLILNLINAIWLYYHMKKTSNSVELKTQGGDIRASSENTLPNYESLKEE